MVQSPERLIFNILVMVKYARHFWKVSVVTLFSSFKVHYSPADNLMELLLDD